MKKILILLFCFCLALTGAAAAEIQERINAPEHVSDAFYSPSGKTIIQVDADVIVPLAERVPLYLVTPRLFTADEMARTAAAVFAGRDYCGTVEYRTYPVQLARGLTCTQYHASFASTEQGQGEFFATPVSKLETIVRVLDNGTIDASSMRYQRFSDMLLADAPRFDSTSNHPHVADGKQPFGCAISLEDARALADQLASDVAPHMVNAGYGIQKVKPTPPAGPTFGYRIYEQPDEGAWIFFYTPAYDLPCNYVEHRTDREYGVSCSEESLCVIVDDLGVENLDWFAPYDITGVLKEDCELLSFDQVMDVARSLLPLTLMSGENNGDTLQAYVSQIRLGYMRIMRSGHPEQYQLIPVWDFYGGIHYYRYGELRSKSDYAFKSLLTVNAMDGTVIDRDLGY